jgi:hypothetical protein
MRLDGWLHLHNVVQTLRRPLLATAKLGCQPTMLRFWRGFFLRYQEDEKNPFCSRQGSTVRPGYGEDFWVKFGDVEAALRGLSGDGNRLGCGGVARGSSPGQQLGPGGELAGCECFVLSINNTTDDFFRRGLFRCLEIGSHFNIYRFRKLARWKRLSTFGRDCRWPVSNRRLRNEYYYSVMTKRAILFPNHGLVRGERTPDSRAQLNRGDNKVIIMHKWVTRSKTYVKAQRKHIQLNP